MESDALDRLIAALGCSPQAVVQLSGIARWHGEASMCAAWERVGGLPVEARASAFFKEIRTISNARKSGAHWPHASYEAWQAALDGRGAALPDLVTGEAGVVIQVDAEDLAAARETVLQTLRATADGRMSGADLGQILLGPHGAVVRHYGSLTLCLDALFPEVQRVGSKGYDIVWAIMEESGG